VATRSIPESEEIMSRAKDRRPLWIGVAALCAVAAASAAAASTYAGTWQHAASTPVELQAGVTSVSTGTNVIVAGLTSRSPKSGFTDAIENAAIYNPSTNTWKTLPHAPSTPTYCRRDAVWTGTQMLVWGCRATAYNLAKNSWRRLPDPPTGHGFTVWTGTQMIGWGGGCCGDAGADGSAYTAATNSWRKLPRSPLAPEQSPVAVWDGHELLVFVSGISPANAEPYPARFARAAAYDPAKRSWRRLAPRPVAGGTGVWDGFEAIVVASGRAGRLTEAYNPSTNRWRILAPLPAQMLSAHAVWTGTRVIAWSGNRGYAFDPSANRWQPLPPAPLTKRDSSQTAWAAKRFVVVGGVVATPGRTATGPQYPKDGAVFKPAG
jgi:N-acetylneuraminic acid mutarotase